MSNLQDTDSKNPIDQNNQKSNLSDLLKQNKLLILGIGLLFFVLLTAWFFSESPQKTPLKTRKAVQPTNEPMVTDNASGDNTAESLNALTEQLHEVIKSNEDLQKSNAALNAKNDNILQHIREEVQENLESELQKRGEDNQAQISLLQQQLQTVNNELKNGSSLSGSATGNYSVDTNSLVGSQVIHVNGETLVSIPDISGAHTTPAIDANNSQDTHLLNSSSDNSNDSILHANTDSEGNGQDSKDKSDPYYTIPNGATLANSITMTALIGRVPVDGVVKSPYPFKMILGSNDMAANGLRIPGINGAIIQGYTVGDMALSCVRGYVTAITFLFPDGTISTHELDTTNNSSDVDFTQSLGYLSEPNGNPCFSGKFYTNAPQYLTTMIALGALNTGGQAYSMAQQTSMANAFGGTTSSVTGSVGKYMLGGAVQGGTQQVMDWYTEREKNSFDAVYVPAGEKAVINITKEIPINYNPKGRKIYYEHNQNSHNNSSMD